MYFGNKQDRVGNNGTTYVSRTMLYVVPTKQTSLAEIMAFSMALCNTFYELTVSCLYALSQSNYR